MGLLELNVRVAISVALLVSIFAATVPPLMLYSEQKEFTNNIDELTHASINKIKLSNLQSNCPTSLSNINVTDLVTENLLDSSWLDRGTNFTITIEHKRINTSVGTSYTKPAFVHIQYSFASIQEAQPFYELADLIDKQNISFITAINSNDYALNSYYLTKNGCSTL
ncbi:hypothetical protein VITU102760_24810 [Vibrio tubiashii]|uniref:Uncharacterized protein n=1 Tax=Vibrio tubiashii ATCC 19109 TaxID=1051646 RepID=F9T6T0_9VIBR|nr:hypothetical protein [Vibrio tubiashii]AIW17494.1 hypothetical protein IX91_25900 [Vibrio tubiashii ATCC 19109]EGU54485.1 hypothetical protein VITU9109_02887 [Vibrio tubiashii ATCC 19109]EIF05992.1 hypothetical protein VT1337_00595 [Vibrio tubiashii NCIMB 1337 = ATCC 19106]